ncbi:hypothetical protein D3C87_1071600 [compost metagenome]
MTLPAAVVGVLGWQWREVGCRSLRSSGVKAREFVDQYVQGPAVGNDVVQRHQQLVIFVVETHQRHPQQRTFFQVEPGACFVFADLLRTGLALGRRQVADVDQLQVEFGAGSHLLQSHAVALEETRAQGFVALDQLLEAGMQGVFVQFAAQTQGTGNVIGAALWVELPGDPQTVLCQRLRHRLAARQCGDCTLGAAAVLLLLRNGCGER